jgi:hypothetical protein
MSDWKKELKGLFDTPESSGGRARAERRRVKGFIADVVVPAFEEVAAELQEYARDVEVEFGDRMASITVFHEGTEEFHYEVRVKAYRKRDFAFPAIPLFDAEGQSYRAEAGLRSGSLHLDVTNFTPEELIESFLREYRRHFEWER